ncbi:MAG: hypothetical protein O2981_02385 [Proteobacteria bacterium]|nr:hypothetical protein [Pseudomonadota bacterium]
MTGLDKHVLATIIGLLLGIAFSVIGFVNMFWGNDPFFGVIIFAASSVYYLPAIDAFKRLVSARTVTIVKVVLGVLILWASLGVGELFEKIALMRSSFPFPNITGI